MKGRYADGGKLPPAEEAARTAVLEPVEPAPLTEKQRMGKMVVKGELPKGYRHRKEPDEGPTTVKKAKGGSASARADGCCQRGKTRGKMV